MTKKRLTYIEAMAEVEQILARLRSSELGIDELSGAVRRATELIALCRQELLDTEKEVEQLINNEE